jgi:hypothetical protein
LNCSVIKSGIGRPDAQPSDALDDFSRPRYLCGMTKRRTTKKAEAPGIIEPGNVYTLERAAAILGCPPRTLREDFVNAGRLAAMPFGRGYLLTGKDIVRLVRDNAQLINRRELRVA